jgi:hypothetical protein
VPEAERAPDDVKGAGGAGCCAGDKRDFLASKTAKSVELTIHGAELLSPFVDAMRLLDD